MTIKIIIVPQEYNSKSCGNLPQELDFIHYLWYSCGVSCGTLKTCCVTAAWIVLELNDY